ncbi:hypothetical protein MMC12_001122 [Toensbergia leucococca]|nr:hypothetical protein [Toensbergia leucococca]
MSGSEKPHLARIRDNQRRSRARRQEYLQELEERLRDCRLQGVEVSSELQTAARSVADENRRLRALLKSRGITGDEINAYVIESKDDGRPISRLAALESLLGKEIPCEREGNGCFGRDLGPCRPPSTSTPAPMLESVQDYPLREAFFPPFANQTVDDDNMPPIQRSSGLDLPPNSFVQQLLPEEIQAKDSTATHSNNELFEDNNTSSCEFAAGIITGMKSGLLNSEIKIELGCRTEVDCKVDNSTVFTVLDRYAG